MAKRKRLGIAKHFSYLLVIWPAGGATGGDLGEAVGLRIGTEVTRRIRDIKNPAGGRAAICDRDTNRYTLTPDDKARIRASDGFKAWRGKRT